MRTLYTWLAGTVFAGALACVAPGCGGNSGLEKPPEVTKPVNPAKDMPGYDPAQDKSKKQVKQRM